MKASGIGGQAVIEGIMMRNKEDYAVAVRLENGEITVKKDKYTGVVKSKFLTTTPFIRGFFNFIDSMVLGISTLTWAADQFAIEEDENGNKDDGLPPALMVGTVIFSIVLAIGLFVVLPFFLSGLFKNVTSSSTLIALFEGIIRLLIFIVYISGISMMKDIKRVYMYHGGEHKCINCIEHGLPLTVENVRQSSKEHKRCGTSFLLFVILFSVIIGMFIRVKTLWLKVLIRILLIPVLAGISYEFIKLAGRSNSKVMDILSKPGLWMQGLTVREPDDSMIEVAIKAVEAVFDWKEFLEHFDDADKEDSCCK